MKTSVLDPLRKNSTAGLWRAKCLERGPSEERAVILWQLSAAVPAGLWAVRSMNVAPMASLQRWEPRDEQAQIVRASHIVCIVAFPDRLRRRRGPAQGGGHRIATVPQLT